jgi:endonuclease YncB( thermonuclease family)
MKNRIKITATLFLFTVFNNTQAEDFLMFSGQAIEVWDGDSFTVRLAESSQQFLEPYLTPPEYRTGIISVQLAGIDCPERSQNHPFWQQSRTQLMRYLNNQYLNIQVEINRNRQINRTASHFIAVVRAGRNPTAINQAMVAAGWAKDDYRFSFGYPYIMSQWEAMNRRRGIWANTEQYHAENEFRMRLYGTGGNSPEIHTYPEYRAREASKRGGEAPRQFSQSGNKEYARQPRWKNEVPGNTRIKVPQFKNP